MADIKKHTSRHLRSARQWLTRAEESFDKEKDIRGELDLFLAKAELQHVQEANRYGKWRYKYPLLRHGLALGLAMTVAFVSFSGGYWWMHGHEVLRMPSSLAGQDTVQKVTKPVLTQQEVVPISQVPNSTQLVASPKITEPMESSGVTIGPPVVNTTTALPAQQTNSKDSEVLAGNKQFTRQVSEQETILSPNEMQKLVRAAGKSLRGQ